MSWRITRVEIVPPMPVTITFADGEKITRRTRPIRVFHTEGQVRFYRQSPTGGTA